MQQVYAPPNGGKIALLYGLSIGLILAALTTAIALIETFALANTSDIIVSLLLLTLVFLLGLAAYFIAGILASRQTAKVGTGCIAGLWTGVFYALISFVVSITLFFSVTLPRVVDAYTSNPIHSSSAVNSYRTGLIIVEVVSIVFGLLFATGLGAGMGALGGLIGKHTSKIAPQPAYPYPPQPYLAQPYSVQPYPTQPYPSQQVPQGRQAQGNTESADPNQSYSEHPY